MQNAELDEAQGCRRNVNNIRYADDTTLMSESRKKKKATKEPLDESERGE